MREENNKYLNERIDNIKLVLSLDWNAILISIMPTLILLIAGFFIWKWQFIYQKKVEAYTNILPYLRKMEGYFYQDLFNEHLLFEDEHSKEMKKEVLAFLKNKQTSLIEMFVFSFGESYRTPIGEIEEMLRLNAVFGWDRALKNEEKKHIIKQFKIIYSLGKELKAMGKWYNIKFL